MPDDYVETLVALIREKQTTDIEELDVETSHPDIYKLLRDEIVVMLHNAVSGYDMREFIFADGWDVDTDELIDYCRQNCGFKDSYFDEKNEETHKIKEEQFYDRFWAWYHDYVDTAPFEEIHNLFYELYDTEYECDELGFEYYQDYYPSIFIPQQIIDMAGVEVESEEYEE
jgi:superfamily I DNA/RNA helicase